MFELENTIVVPSQMPLDCIECDFMESIGEIGKVVTTSAVGASIFAEIATGMSMNVVYSLINMVQLYVYLPLFDVVFPGNLQMFL
jgi:hypothetical protein